MKQTHRLCGVGALLSLTACGTASAVPERSATPRPERPNFLVIVCENISCYLRCYGDSVAVTPHLDRFAKETVRHTRMFTCVGVASV